MEKIKEGNLDNYSTSLKVYTDIIEEVSDDEEIMLAIRYFEDEFIKIIIKNIEIIKICYVFNSDIY